MNPKDLSLRVQQLSDREAIRDCIYRYCRGVDRRDEAALRSVYWPDATDRHGPYSGGAAGFIDWALEKLATSTERSVHNVTNMLIELADTQAAVETYFLAWQRDRDDQGAVCEVFLAGRYVDRFEKREGEWRVAERTVVYDWLRHLEPLDRSESDHFGIREPQGAQFPTDPIYAAIARLSQGSSERECNVALRLGHDVTG